MEDDTEQTGQGGMTDDLMSRGREAAEQSMNDPEMRDRMMGQAQERFGNVPGVGQAAEAFGTRGGAASGEEMGGEPAADYETGADVSTREDEGLGDTESSQY
jgi:hypothetical protein